MALEPLYTSIIGIARAMFFAQGLDIRLTGEKNFPRTGGAVVVVNHTGYMDFVYAGVPARVWKRFIRFMAKAEVFEHPVAGPVMRNLRHIPVDRTADANAYEAAVRKLREGELIGVFPEATISRSFEIKDFKSGAARMAKEAGVPILPVTIWGSQRVWTKGLPKNMLRPKVPVLIDTAEPMEVTGDPAEFTEELRGFMQGRLEELQARYEEIAGPYPEGASWVPRRLGGSAPSLEEANALDEAEHQARLAKKRGSGAGSGSGKELGGQAGGPGAGGSGSGSADDAGSRN